jgi:hypothetical protein
MSRALSYAPAALFVWVLAGAALGWGRLPGSWRRALALLASAGGLVSLVLAVGSEGVRESSTLGFLIATPYVSEQASASASLPYYLLTGIGLSLGTLGLALRDDVATRWSRHWFGSAVALSLLVTALRFTLEKAAAPRAWAWATGVTWLAPLVGAFFAVNLKGRGFRTLAGALLAYGLIVRGSVAALMVVATKQGLGSHYDVSSLVSVRHPLTGRMHEFVPGSLDQLLAIVIVPQLVFWPIFTLVAGLLGAGIAWLLTRPAATPPARLTAAGTGGAPAPADPGLTPVEVFGEAEPKRARR